MKMKPVIEYFDMPPEIRDQYQYLTEAKMDKLRATGCPVNFRPLEDAVQDYGVNYLQKPDRHL
jgi:ADP-L-glycero-D-manno-heptose 6-epimerase